MKKILLAIILLGQAVPAVAPASVLPDESTEYGARRIRGSYLLHMIGPNAVGMGGTYAASGAPNPGALGLVNGGNATAMHDFIGQGMALSYLSLAKSTPIGGFSAGGLMVDYGSLENRDALGNIDGSRAITDWVGLFGWGLSFGGPTSFGSSAGATVEYIQEAGRGSVYGASFGLITRVSRSVSAGLSVEHIGPGRNDFRLPERIVGGVAVGMRNDTVRIASDLGYRLVDRDFYGTIGVELEVSGMFLVRGGYRFRGENRALGGASGLAGGMGIILDRMKNGGRFGMDYAIQPFGSLGESHRIAVSYTN